MIEQVYIVVAGWNYDGEKIIGVFASEEKANQAKAEIEEGKKPL